MYSFTCTIEQIKKVEKVGVWRGGGETTVNTSTKSIKKTMCYKGYPGDRNFSIMWCILIVPLKEGVLTFVHDKERKYPLELKK